MKKKLRKCMAVALTCALALGFSYSMPAHHMTVCAAENAQKTIASLCTDAIAAPTAPSSTSDKWKGSYVYFGTYSSAPVKYRVLDPSTTDYGGTTMLLDSDSGLVYGQKFNESSSDGNVWADGTTTCAIRTYLNSTFLNSAFSANEKAVIASSNKAAADTSTSTDIDATTYSTYYNHTSLENDKIFLLDASEITNPSYGYSSSNGYALNRVKNNVTYSYWLRTAYVDPDLVGGIYNLDTNGSKGAIERRMVSNNTVSVCPALNVDLSKVLFSSVVSDTEATDKEYKLTLIDSADYLSISQSGDATREGDTVTVSYSVGTADTSKLNRISVLITDKPYEAGNANGAQCITYAALDFSKGSVNDYLTEGTGTFTIPADYADKSAGTDYHVYLIAEEVNTGNLTDYASKPTEITDIPAAARSVEVPTASPKAGTYTTTQAVTLATATEGADIYYSTDDSIIPDGTIGTLYTGAITVTGTAGTSVTTTIQAIAVKGGMASSDLQTFVYTINIPAAGGSGTGDKGDAGGSGTGGKGDTGGSGAGGKGDAGGSGSGSGSDGGSTSGDSTSGGSGTGGSGGSGSGGSGSGSDGGATSGGSTSGGGGTGGSGSDGGSTSGGSASGGSGTGGSGSDGGSTSGGSGGSGSGSGTSGGSSTADDDDDDDDDSGSSGSDKGNSGSGSSTDKGSTGGTGSGSGTSGSPSGSGSTSGTGTGTSSGSGSGTSGSGNSGTGTDTSGGSGTGSGTGTGTTDGSGTGSGTSSGTGSGSTTDQGGSGSGSYSGGSSGSGSGSDTSGSSSHSSSGGSSHRSHSSSTTDRGNTNNDGNGSPADTADTTTGTDSENLDDNTSDNQESIAGGITASIKDASDILQTIKDKLDDALTSILARDDKVQTGPYVQSDTDDIRVEIPSELQKDDRSFYLMTVDDDNIIILRNESADDGVFEATGEADTVYSMLYEDGETPLASMITDTGVLDMPADSDCYNHLLGLGLALLGLLAAALLARKGKRYFWAATAAGLALALAASATGSCGLDWACFAGEAVVTVAATAALWMTQKKGKEQ